MKYIILAFLATTLSACTVKRNYLPEEYEITNDRIEDFKVKGEIQIVNFQTDQSDRLIGTSGAVEMYGDYKSVTEHLKTQLEKEISENSTLLSSTTGKKIQLEVFNFWVELKAFRYVSRMNFNYKLGNNNSVSVRISHGTPGNIYRALNGSIALGVIEILKRDDVIAYLAE